MSDEHVIPFSTPFERLGGREVVERVIDAFYDRIDADPDLRPLFPEDLAEGREKQKLFFEQWLGGEPRYQRQHGPPMMRRRHLEFPITVAAAERWLTHFRAALEECGADPEVTRQIIAGLSQVAARVVNTSDVAGGAAPAGERGSS